jgi:hypothetical protein
LLVTRTDGIWQIDPLDRELPQRLIPDGYDAVPSPDGRQILYFHETDRCSAICLKEFRVAPRSGGQGRRIGPDLVEPGEAVWTR